MLFAQQPAQAFCASTGKVPPATPHEQDCGQDEANAVRSVSTSGASTSTFYLGSHRKRKMNSRSSSACVSKHRASGSGSSVDNQRSSTCDSSRSSDDYLRSWSVAYAASRGRDSEPSCQGGNDSLPARRSCDLLCQEMAVEDEPQACPTDYSSLSQHSSASETCAMDASPMAVCGHGGYTEDPPLAEDLEQYELPHVHPGSLSYSLAKVYGFSVHVIEFGTVFFQRLAARDGLLLSAALGCPDFAPFVQGVTLQGVQRESLLPCSVGHPTHSWQSAKIYCMAIHLTCIYLAAKSVEMVPYKRLLQTMLTHVHERAVSREQAAALEMQVIQGLDWRLSPYFLTPRREFEGYRGDDDFCVAW